MQEELCQFTWSFTFNDVGPGGWFPGHSFRRYFHIIDQLVDTRPVNEFWEEPRNWNIQYLPNDLLPEDDSDITVHQHVQSE